MISTVELRELRVFLALADELHFGRAAARLTLTPSRVSQATRTLERRVGGKLFERTSRTVALTPLGERFLAELRPAYDHLEAVLVHAANLAAAAAAGPLRIGATMTGEGPALSRLIKAFQSAHPGCEVILREVDVWDPYLSLRRGQIDVLINWLAVDEDDLRAGPPIACYERVLAVARDHPLAIRASVSVEDLAGQTVAQPPAPFPAALTHAIFPPRTPSGRPIRRVPISRSISEIAAQVALGRIVHPTGREIAAFARDDIVLIPIEDLKPMPLGLIWLRSRENPTILALADLAAAQQPLHSRPQ
jgi:DNA-binding transcriptional LysR family regulator